MNIHVHMDVGGNTCKGVTQIQLFKTQGKIHTVNKSCHKRVKASQLKTLFSPMAKGEMKQQFGCLSQQVTQIAIWLIIQFATMLSLQNKVSILSGGLTYSSSSRTQTCLQQSIFHRAGSQKEGGRGQTTKGGLQKEV